MNCGECPIQLCQDFLQSLPFTPEQHSWRHVHNNTNEWWPNRQRQHITYKFCCGDHVFLFTAQQHKVSTWQSSSVSSTCLAPLCISEIFCFSVLHLWRVWNIISTPSCSRWILWRISCSILTWAHLDTLQSFYLGAGRRKSGASQAPLENVQRFSGDQCMSENSYCVLVHSKGQATKPLGPTNPIMQLNSL